jgi:hypothetical protein
MIRLTPDATEKGELAAALANNRVAILLAAESQLP